MAKNKYTAAAIAVALAIAGCSRNGGANNDKKSVCVSIEPQRWVAEQIAADRVEVTSLMSGDANPENFDPPLSALRNASQADVYMQMGHLPWEQSLIEKLKQSNPGMKVVDTSNGIALITGTHSHDGHSHEADPHTWSSVRNARLIAANMLDALKDIDPGNADFFTQNYNRLTTRLDSLDNAITVALDSCSEKAFMVWHPSLSYFARDYGLTQIAVGAENKESTVRSMKEQIDKAVGNNVKVFFIQPAMDGGKSDEIVSLTGAEKVIIHPMAYDWWGEMKCVSDALTKQ
ncbi:MAG: zinc ABC transporter solute-binding protein [Muribaculaceae bacterium]|nr:zinc ABC transporter solute-binding protein [Muribaculaceae bacterium]